MKRDKIIILVVGFVITLLLTIAIVYTNKMVFSNSIFKTYKNYADIKLVINNLFGFTEMLVVASTMALFVRENKKK